MRSAVKLSGLDLFSSEDVGLGSIRIWLSRSDDLFMLDCVRKLTSSGKNSCPTLHITVFNTTGVKKEMSEVINRINAEVSARLNKREIEGRNIGTALCNIEKRGLPIYDIFPNFLLTF